jgi:hypothetical protein
MPASGKMQRRATRRILRINPCSFRDNKLSQIHIALKSRIMQQCSALSIPRIDIGPMVDQEFRNDPLARAGRIKEV